MTELENTIDIDCFNDEQRPNNLDYDCLEFGEYLMNSWKIDTSDEDYERYRDEQAERTEDAYREKMESMFEYFIS
jgi:hypothetical protein